MSDFYETHGILVEQPLAAFFLVNLPSTTLLEICYSIPASEPTNRTHFSISGTQRLLRKERLREIARYIDTEDASFPNTVILGANYQPDGLPMLEELAWTAHPTDLEGIWRLRIPKLSKSASIIDGQHRLMAFQESTRPSMSLACAVFLDLPVPYHAYVFATINFNQRKVDKSLAYQLFGASLDQEPPEAWSPEKVAVFLARRLNSEENSPLRGMLRMGIIGAPRATSRVSLATVVDGIISLISNNPKRDRDSLAAKPTLLRSRKLVEAGDLAKTPLRDLYREVDDLALYQIVQRYFVAVDRHLWSVADDVSYITKTVGVQALFDVLRHAVVDGTVKLATFSIRACGELLTPCASIDFSDSFFQASGTGRMRIRNCLLLRSRMRQLNEMGVNPADVDDYVRLTG